MEFQRYVQILKRYWKSILAIALLSIAIAAGVTLKQQPAYSAASSLFLTVDSGGTAGELSSGATYAERQVTSYVTVAKTALVLAPVVEELQLDVSPEELAERLTVTAPASTSIITVAATDSSPQGAADLSNAVTDSLRKVVDELAPPGPEGANLVSATVLDPALPPEAPSSPRPAMNLALGAFIGLLLGLGQAIVRGVVDTRIRSTEELAAVTDLPVLAAVAHNKGLDAARADSTDGIAWANAEAYRKLRTNVGFVGLGGERRSSMVVTSSLVGEGKTETSINLARVLALAGERVLLVDADLRRPQVAKRLKLDSELGLSDVLTGRGTLPQLVTEFETEYLHVLSAGTVPPNPSELLGSEAMSHLITAAERQYDYVIFDVPPVLPVSDAVILSVQVGGAIVVSRSGVIREKQLSTALEMLQSADATVLGVVLNAVPANKADAYYGYYSSHTREKSQSKKSAVSAD